MTKTKGVLYVAIIAVLFVLGYLGRRQHDTRVDAQVSSHTLPEADKAKYIIDEAHHELVEVTEGESDTSDSGSGQISAPRRTVRERTIYLPPHASIEIRKDGTVAVTARAWGTEIRPFVGMAVDTDRRAAAQVGLDLLYWHRWEAGIAGSFALYGGRDVRIVGSVGYNIWSNTSIYVGVDNHKAVSVGVALKL